jgi:RNA polymerase primary sigma factor
MSTLDSANRLNKYFSEISQRPLLSRDEETALARRSLLGDEEARQELIERNLRFVVKIAQDYAHRGLPLEDLIAEGNLGLMKAVERFDPDKGAKLSTYASWWIKQFVRKAITDQSRTIRLPSHVQSRIYKLGRATEALAPALGREPSVDELASEVDLSSKQVLQALNSIPSTVSLESPLGGDGDGRLADMVADTGAVSPAESVEVQDDFEKVRKLVDALPERERLIIAKRFGLDGEDPETLDIVGKRVGLTRERIRQLQNDSLVRLRLAIDGSSHPDEETMAISA